MISGGFQNNNSISQSPSGASRAATVLGAKAQRGVSSLMGNAARTGATAVKTFAKILFHIMPKKILLIAIITLLGLLGLSSCAYVFTKQDAGQKGNLIDSNNYSYVPQSYFMTGLTTQDNTQDTTTEESDPESDPEETNENGLGSGKSQAVTRGNEFGFNYSVANANCKAFYELLAKNKSVYKLCMDEDGALKPAQDVLGVDDYFENDKNYYIEWELLYALNEKVFSQDYVFPEAFLHPVPFDENYKLLPLLDENNNVCVSSPVLTKSGEKTEDTLKNLTNYGLASVLVYKEQSEDTFFEGAYNSMDVIDNFGQVTQVEIAETIPSCMQSSKKEHVLTNVVTFAGDVSYTYEPSHTLVESVSEGMSSNPYDNVDKYCYVSTTISFYNVVETYADGTSAPSVYMAYNGDLANAGQNCGFTQEQITAYIDGRVAAGEIVSGSVTVSPITRQVHLCKYKTSDSGVYVDFVDQTDYEVNDVGNGYLYDYLTNFACYKPLMERSYNTFKNMSSSPSSNQNPLSSQNTTVVTGSGADGFEQLYNGSQRENIEKFWDCLLIYGFTEEQAAAILGNSYVESGYQPTAVNPSSGAKGLLQWCNTPAWETLDAFAMSRGVAWDDLDTQILFACMQADPNNTHTGYYDGISNGWNVGNPRVENYRQQFADTSNDLETLTAAFGFGFENYGGNATDSIRIQMAQSALRILGGKTFGYEFERFEPSETGDNKGIGGLTSSTTAGMNQYDKERFNKFYFAVENYSYVDYYAIGLNGKDIEDILITANTFINHTTKSEERLNSTDTLWKINYLTDLQKEIESSVSDHFGEGSATAMGVVDRALSYVGYLEEYDANGRQFTIFHKEYAEVVGLDPNSLHGNPWCAYFVNCILYECGLCPEYHTPAPIVSKTCTNLLDKGGEQIPLTQGQPGDIAGMTQIGNEGGYEHIGIIVENLGDGRYLTVEGNTGSESETDGEGVFTKHRSTTPSALYIKTIVRPNYPASTTTIDGEVISNLGQSSSKTLESLISKEELSAVENTKSKQLVVVKASGNTCSVYLFEKNKKKWDSSIYTTGLLGRAGTADAASKVEGDSKTPLGLYPIGKAFYTPKQGAKRPSTKLDVFSVNKNTYWVDDPASSDYNKKVSKDPGCSAEHMIDYPVYKYGFVINYNKNPIVKGKGSAIFFHCSSGSNTAGCVACEESFVVSLLEKLDKKKKPYILITK